MIHYHGLPITHATVAARVIFHGRAFWGQHCSEIEIFTVKFGKDAQFHLVNEWLYL